MFLRVFAFFYAYITRYDSFHFFVFYFLDWLIKNYEKENATNIVTDNSTSINLNKSVLLFIIKTNPRGTLPRGVRWNERLNK